jgi:hypothetical protein
LLFFIHNACGYTSSASASSAPSPQGEGFEFAFLKNVGEDIIFPKKQ